MHTDRSDYGKLFEIMYNRTLKHLQPKKDSFLKDWEKRVFAGVLEMVVLCGGVVRALDLRSTGRRFDFLPPLSRPATLDESFTVHTYVPLLPYSIIWYRPMSGEAVRLGR